MSTLMEIMPDKPCVSIDVNTNGNNANQTSHALKKMNQGCLQYRQLMSTLMEIIK